MALLSSDKILEMLPSLFELNLNNAVDIYRKLEKIFAFDEGFIYFANPDSLQLKSSYKKHANYELDKVFPISGEVKKFVFDKKGKICSQTDDFVDVIELKGSRQNSFLVSKISIRSTVFGVVVLSKREDNFFSQEDLFILNSVSSILSYVFARAENSVELNSWFF